MYGSSRGKESFGLNLEELLPEVGDRRTVRGESGLEVDGFELGFKEGSDIAWELDLRRLGGGVEITGTLSGEVVLECCRCLEEYRFPLDIRVREHAVWLSGEDIEAEDEYAVEEGVLELEPVLRDLIALTLPSRRVCDEACRGLCIKCGANLNVESCTCEVRRPDSRLEVLKELKERLDEREEGGA